MGKLITITGVSGVGKTTFARLLAKKAGLPAYLEQHGARLFHKDAASSSANMLANQMDFLLYRAEQERAIRQSEQGGVTDGGLDTDYHVFTRLFHQRGLLTDAEYILCTQFYSLIRKLLPPPEWIIYLKAPVEVVGQRFVRRSRAAEVSRLEDLSAQQALIEEWLAGKITTHVLTIDAGSEDAGYEKALQFVLANIL